MAYTHSNQRLIISGVGVPLSLAAVAVVGAATCPVGSRPLTAREISITVSVAPTVTDVIAQVIWRPNPASATDQIVLGELTVPVATPIGQVVRKKITPVKIPPGGYFVVNVTQAATAGTGMGGVLISEDSDAVGEYDTATESD